MHRAGDGERRRLHRLGGVTHRPFPRVWLAWGRGWAIQFYGYPCISFGLHLDFARRLVDLHFLWFTVALGPSAQITGLSELHLHTCRGFLRSDDPAARIL
jgi:hypothetical protein